LVWIPQHKLKIKLNQLVTQKKNPTKLKRSNHFFYIYLFIL